ncbi:hypothetical protein IQ07DRAFT_551868, partial [Pyrenochaeta sp. DS3sAY3a]
MPPKIVYGKKKASARQQSDLGFAGIFVSPKKDENTDSLEDLQEGMGKLGIEEKNEPVREKKNVEVKKRRGKAQKGGGEDEKEKRESSMRTGSPSLDEKIKALSIGDVRDEVDQKGRKEKKQRKARKALKDRDANVVKEEMNSLVEGSREEPREEEERCIEKKTEEKLRGRSKKNASKSKSETPASTQRRRQRPTNVSPARPADCFSSYVQPLLALGENSNIASFQDWSAELEPHFEIMKIAEASFSEVYRLRVSTATSDVKEESVLKVVALKTPPNAPLPCQLQTRAVRDRETQMARETWEREENDVWKSDVADVLSEVKLLQNLNHIPGFTVFRELTVVQGRPSTAFANAWKEWNKSRPRGKKSEFPDPSKKASYDDTQLWAVIEMQDAGTDCEKIMELGGLSSIWEVWDVFWGVCLSIAKAEEACKFEHRDLHLGNICVRSSRQDGDVTQSEIEDPVHRKLHFSGLETTVIDYTLSRADIILAQTPRSSSPSYNSGSTSSSELDVTDVAYLDLDKDPALFEGDASEEYQYEIYRYMRGAALSNNPLDSTPPQAAEPEPEPEPEPPSTPRRSPRKNTHIRFDEPDTPRRSPRKHNQPPVVLTPSTPAQTPTSSDLWRAFHPKTNLVWAHFLLHKLLSHLQSLNAVPQKLSARQLAQMGASDAGIEELKVNKKALKLHRVLLRVGELLCPVALGREEGLGSVKELVVLALEERWLRVGDVA